MRYDTASATYTLQLKDVQRSDEGRYECQIIVALNNKVTQSLFLRVLEPPIRRGFEDIVLIQMVDACTAFLVLRLVEIR